MAKFSDDHEERRRQFAETWLQKFYRDVNDRIIQLGIAPDKHPCDPSANEVYDRSIFVKIHQEIYPISCEVLIEVFSRFGSLDCVERLSRGFHSTVRFSNKESTIRAFNSLNGRQIYEDCCQLELIMVKETTSPQIVEDSGEQELPYESAKSLPTNLDEESAKTSNPQSEAEMVCEDSEEPSLVSNSEEPSQEIDLKPQFFNSAKLVQIGSELEDSQDEIEGAKQQTVEDSVEQDIQYTSSMIDDSSKGTGSEIIQEYEWYLRSIEDSEEPNFDKMRILSNSPRTIDRGRELQIQTEISKCSKVISYDTILLETTSRDGASKEMLESAEVSSDKIDTKIAHQVFDEMTEKDIVVFGLSVVLNHDALRVIHVVDGNWVLIFDLGGLFCVKTVKIGTNMNKNTHLPSTNIHELEFDKREVVFYHHFESTSSAVGVVLFVLKFLKDDETLMPFDRGRICVVQAALLGLKLFKEARVVFGNGCYFSPCVIASLYGNILVFDPGIPEWANCGHTQMEICLWNWGDAFYGSFVAQAGCYQSLCIAERVDCRQVTGGRSDLGGMLDKESLMGLKASNVSRSGTMTIPVQLSMRHLPSCRTNVVFKNVEGKSWTLSSVPTIRVQMMHTLCGGWTAFAVASAQFTSKNGARVCNGGSLSNQTEKRSLLHSSGRSVTAANSTEGASAAEFFTSPLPNFVKVMKISNISGPS